MENENARLKRLIAELCLDKVILKKFVRKSVKLDLQDIGDLGGFIESTKNTAKK
jgi:hypothetical protein|tara:strand:- start:96 stop:257 length:162 start_codon:yes stop_codon:yes gene_type:complete